MGSTEKPVTAYFGVPVPTASRSSQVRTRNPRQTRNAPGYLGNPCNGIPAAHVPMPCPSPMQSRSKWAQSPQHTCRLCVDSTKPGKGRSWPPMVRSPVRLRDSANARNAAASSGAPVPMASRSSTLRNPHKSAGASPTSRASLVMSLPNSSSVRRLPWFLRFRKNEEFDTSPFRFSPSWPSPSRFSICAVSSRPFVFSRGTRGTGGTFAAGKASSGSAAESNTRASCDSRWTFALPVCRRRSARESSRPYPRPPAPGLDRGP